jgi:hypothetical protein
MRRAGYEAPGLKFKAELESETMTQDAPELPCRLGHGLRAPSLRQLLEQGLGLLQI